MRKIRNPRYAPEFLERKLCPSASVGNLGGAVALYSTPDPGVSQNSMFSSSSLPADVTAPAPSANTVYYVVLAPANADFGDATSDDNSDSGDLTDNDVGDDAPTVDNSDSGDLTDNDPNPSPNPDPDPDPDNPDPNADPGDPPVVPLPPAPVGPAVPD